MSEKSRNSCYVGFLTLIMLLTSCLFNAKKGFTVYKQPVTINASSTPLKFNGVYMSKEEHGSVFYLYANGYIKWVGWGRECCPANGKYVSIESVEKDELYYSKEHWGQYQIIGDSLIIQTFNKHTEQIAKRWVLEEKGKILNDSTFILTSNYSYWLPKTLNDSLEDKIPHTYHFFKTEKKPDSTYVWFKNKDWFLENVNPSRK